MKTQGEKTKTQEFLQKSRIFQQKTQNTREFLRFLCTNFLSIALFMTKFSKTDYFFKTSKTEVLQMPSAIEANLGQDFFENLNFKVNLNLNLKFLIHSTSTKLSRKSSINRNKNQKSQEPKVPIIYASLGLPAEGKKELPKNSRIFSKLRISTKKKPSNFWQISTL